MFKFNFSSDNPDEADDIPVVEVKAVNSDNVDLKVSKKLEITDEQYQELAETLKNSKANCFMSGETEIGYLDNSAMTDNESDLIPRVYEGGFKIWECTQDLADFFTGSEDQNEFRDKKVCDLGCSAGILGILALVNGASRVDFQDYNEDVLEKLTIGNCVLSCEERETPSDFAKCAFYSGDWDIFRDLTTNEDKYDVIVTSETIYNPDNYLKLLNFFKNRLRSDGTVFLSAKSYYFGVSGNVLDFCKLLEKDAVFSYTSVWKSTDGLQREILQIKFAEKL